MTKINFGSGPVYVDGWINIDTDGGFKRDEQYIYSIDDESVEYIVAHHSLQCVDVKQLSVIMSNFYRVLKPRGIIRISIPDIISAFNSYLENDIEFFPKMNSEPIDERFTHWLTWYGQNINPMTEKSLKNMLTTSKFKILELKRKNRTNAFDKSIIDLDTRYAESIYIEAIK